MIKKVKNGRTRQAITIGNKLEKTTLVLLLPGQRPFRPQSDKHDSCPIGKFNKNTRLGTNQTKKQNEQRYATLVLNCANRTSSVLRGEFAT